MATCRFCPETSTEELRLGRRKVPVCARHADFARKAGQELVFTAARMAGATLEKKAPEIFELAKTAFVVFRQAKAHHDAQNRDDA